MEISFAKSKHQNIFNSEKKLRGEYGPRMAEIIKQRLNELSTVETLQTMRFIPGANCHELKQNLKGHLAVDLVQPYRLVFKPDENPVPRKPDGGLDWEQIRSIEITDIIDYH